MISQCLTTSFLQELLTGTHNFNTNTFKLALYTDDANLGPSTTAYTSAGEVSGIGYTAGGQTMTGVVVETGTLSNGTRVAYVDFADVAFQNATLSGVRGALIYNTSASNKSVAVLDFGSDKAVSSAPFVITIPASTPDAALIRIASN